MAVVINEMEVAPEPAPTAAAVASAAAKPDLPDELIGRELEKALRGAHERAARLVAD